MEALFLYLLGALGISFFCSIAEAVLLSITTGHISLVSQTNEKLAELLKKFKSDIDTPLAAILSLNTIAHTAGAVGVGAEAAKVFGSEYVGWASVVMTILILVVSEIIPKTLGSYYWRQLTPSIAYALKYLIVLLYPFVFLSRLITKQIAKSPENEGFSREEFTALAHLGAQEGQLSVHEAKILQNLFKLRETIIADVMTPATVVFSIPETASVDDFFSKLDKERFSRIPVYDDNPDDITGFVLRSDLLLAKSRGNGSTPIYNYRRQIDAIPDKFSLLVGFQLFTSQRDQIMIVVDEYGSLKGVVTLEDIFETLVGVEIIDESDTIEDMQKLAKRQWHKRAKELGIEIDDKI